MQPQNSNCSVTPCGRRTDLKVLFGSFLWIVLNLSPSDRFLLRPRSFTTPHCAVPSESILTSSVTSHIYKSKECHHGSDVVFLYWNKPAVNLKDSVHRCLCLTLYILQMWSPTFEVRCSFFLPLSNTPDFIWHYKTIIVVTFSPSLTFLSLSVQSAVWGRPGRLTGRKWNVLSVCKFGGFTAKLVCLERPPLGSVKPPDDGRSASVSGDSTWFICYEGLASSVGTPCLLTMLLRCLACLVWWFEKL